MARWLSAGRLEPPRVVNLGAESSRVQRAPSPAGPASSGRHAAAPALSRRTRSGSAHSFLNCPFSRSTALPRRDARGQRGIGGWASDGAQIGAVWNSSPPVTGFKVRPGDFGGPAPMHLGRNLLFYGDNLDVLRNRIPSASVDLVYLDPPFNSNRSYNVLLRQRSGAEPKPRSRRSTTSGRGRTRRPVVCTTNFYRAARHPRRPTPFRPSVDCSATTMSWRTW